VTHHVPGPAGLDRADVSTGPPEVKKTERPHPLTPFIRGWVVLAALLAGGLREVVQQRGEGNEGGLPAIRWLLLGVVVVVLIAAFSGWVTWYFTKFVIDDDELRIETGAITKKSQRVTFERVQSVDLIQPLLARLLGLAELRLEVGGGDSHVRLRYLRRQHAATLRDYLLARAHGEKASPHTASTADQFTDDSSTDEVLVRISPARIVAGFLLSPGAFVPVVLLLAGVLIGLRFDILAYLLPAVIPLALSVGPIVGQRVLGQFNFTLARASKGLRITRGLTNLTSQSVPADRIQGLRISQPLFWRRFGWFKVDVDVLGYGGRNSRNNAESNERSATGLLLPTATADEVSLALRHTMPGLSLEGIELRGLPRRARVLDPIGVSFIRYGFNDDVIEQRYGFLTRVRELVPHGKTQSVRVERGPIQRALRLATVHVHTTSGPVNLQVQHIAPADAREVALGQLERARIARRRSGVGAEMAGTGARVTPQGADPGPQPGEDEVLHSFGITSTNLLGSGGESRVFALPDGEHVLRLMHPGHLSEEGDHRLETLYRLWQQPVSGHAAFPARLPVTVERGERFGRHYSIDQRMPGIDLLSFLQHSSSGPRRAALLGYLDTAMQLWQLPLPQPGFAKLVGSDARTFDSLASLCEHQLRIGLADSYDALHERVPGLQAVIDNVLARVRTRQVTPMLVHGDYCPPNVYIHESESGLTISGVGDFSAHTLAADPVMDVAGAVHFVSLQWYPDAEDDARWLAGVAAERLGDQAQWVGVYRHFYALYYSMDPAVLDWSARQLLQP
jgi:putative membrane protein